MANFSIEVIKDGDSWKAIIPEYLIGASGDNLEETLLEAIHQIEGLDDRLAASGVDRNTLIRQLTARCEQQELKNTWKRSLLKFSLPVAVVTASILLVVDQLDNHFDNIRQNLKQDIAEMILEPTGSIEGQHRTSNIQRAAANLNRILLPAAQELNPLYNAMTQSDDNVVEERRDGEN